MFVFHSAARRWKVQRCKAAIYYQNICLLKSLTRESIHCFSTNDFSKSGWFHQVFSAYKLSPAPFQSTGSVQNTLFILSQGGEAWMLSSVQAAGTHRSALTLPISSAVFTLKSHQNSDFLLLFNFTHQHVTSSSRGLGLGTKTRRKHWRVSWKLKEKYIDEFKFEHALMRIN